MATFSRRARSASRNRLNGRRRFAGILSAATMFGTAMVLPADMASAAPGDFGCRSSAIKLKQSTTYEPVIANDPKDPCVGDSDTAVSATLSALLTTGVLTAKPAASPASASASVDGTTITLLGVPIKLGAVQSEAAISCATGSPVATGTSSVASLSIGGVKKRVGSGPATIKVHVEKVATIGVAINEKTASAGAVTQRAAH